MHLIGCPFRDKSCEQLMPEEFFTMTSGWRLPGSVLPSIQKMFGSICLLAVGLVLNKRSI